MRWADTVDFVGVAWFGSDDAFQGFVDRHSLTFPQVSDDDGVVYARFEVPAQPALVIISPDGSVQTLFGAVDDARLDELLGAATA